jgi:hypothetical protein
LRADTNRFLNEYEQDVDGIIAACRADLRGAVRALMLKRAVRANTSAAKRDPDRKSSGGSSAAPAALIFCTSESK